MRLSPRSLAMVAWALSVMVTVLAVVAWGQGFGWHFSRLGSYRFFPLFGLLAFSLMWAHYVMSALRQFSEVDKQDLHTYFEATSLVVLLALVLHPGLLVWQLWRDGLGLPPDSYVRNYVAPALRWASLLGTVSIFMFLAYELRRWFADKVWWRLVEYATDAAIVAIFIHSLKLGSQVQEGWFRIVWLFYGVTLAIALGYIYWRRFNQTKVRVVS